MTPQPLSQIKSPGTLVFGPLVLEMRPELAGLAMQVIGHCSYLELFLTFLVSRLLRSDFRVVAAMLNAVVSSEAQLAAIEAAGQTGIDSKDNRQLFMAVMAFVRKARKRRTRYAHGLLGYSTGLPDALLVIRADVVTSELAEMLTTQRADWSNEILKTGLVYRAADIIADINVVAEAMGHVLNLEQVLAGQLPAADEARRELLGAPNIQRELALMSRKNAPESQTQPPQQASPPTP